MFAFNFGQTNTSASTNTATATTAAATPLIFELPRALSGGDKVTYDGKALKWTSAVANLTITSNVVSTAAITILDKEAVTVAGSMMRIKSASAIVTITFKDDADDQRLIPCFVSIHKRPDSDSNNVLTEYSIADSKFVYEHHDGRSGDVCGAEFKEAFAVGNRKQAMNIHSWYNERSVIERKILFENEAEIRLKASYGLN